MPNPFDFDSNASTNFMDGSSASNAMGAPGLQLPPNMRPIQPSNAAAQAMNADNARTAAFLGSMRQPEQQPSASIYYNPQEDKFLSGFGPVSLANLTEADNAIRQGALNKGYAGQVPAGYLPTTAADITKAMQERGQMRGFWDGAKEVGRNVVTSVAGGIPEMVGKTVQFASDDKGFGHDYGQGLRDFGEYNTKKLGGAPDLYGRGEVSSALIEGASNLGPSGLGMAAALVAPEVAVPAIVVLFGGAQAQDTYEAAIKKGLDKSTAMDAALMTGGIEGAGEAISDLIGGKLISGTGKLLRTLTMSGKVTAEEAAQIATDPKMMRQFAKSMMGAYAVEGATEFGQGYGEAAVEKAYGIRDADPMAEGIHGAKVAAGMTTLLAPFGLRAHHRAAQNRAALGEAIQNVDRPVDLMQAAEIVREEIEPMVGKDEAGQWLNNQEQRADAHIESLVEPWRRAENERVNQEIAARADQERIAARAPSAQPEATAFNPDDQRIENMVERPPIHEQQRFWEGVPDPELATDKVNAKGQHQGLATPYQQWWQGNAQQGEQLADSFGQTPDMFGGENHQGFEGAVEPVSFEQPTQQRNKRQGSFDFGAETPEVLLGNPFGVAAHSQQPIISHAPAAVVGAMQEGKYTPELPPNYKAPKGPKNARTNPKHAPVAGAKNGAQQPQRNDQGNQQVQGGQAAGQQAAKTSQKVATAKASREFEARLGKAIADGQIAADHELVREWSSSNKKADDAKDANLLLDNHLAGPDVKLPTAEENLKAKAAVPKASKVVEAAPDNLTDKQAKVFEYMRQAFVENRGDSVVGADGVLKYAEIGAALGIARGSAKSFIDQAAKRIAKSAGVTVEQMKLALAGAKRGNVEAADEDKLGLSPKHQNSRADLEALVGNDSGAEQSMGIINSVGGSQSDIGADESSSTDVASAEAEEGPVYATRQESVEGVRDMVVAAKNSPVLEEAQSSWNEAAEEREGAPAFHELSKREQVAWIIEYEGIVFDYSDRSFAEFWDKITETQNDYLEDHDGQGTAEERPAERRSIAAPSGQRNEPNARVAGVETPSERVAGSKPEAVEEKVDTKLFRRETLTFTDSTGARFEEEVEHLDEAKFPDVSDALDDVEEGPLASTLDNVEGFYISDSGDAYAYKTEDGKFKVVLPRAVLSGYPRDLRNIINHELAHVAEGADAHSGGRNSSGSVMGVMVQRAKALYEKLPTGSPLKKHLKYPFHAKYPESKSAKLQRVETYAQLVAAYLDPKLAEELKTSSPTLYKFTESILDEIQEQAAEQTGAAKQTAATRIGDAEKPYSRAAPVYRRGAAKAARASVEQVTAKLPEGVRDQAFVLATNLTDLAKRGIRGLAFGHDLADLIAENLPSAKKFFELNSQRGAELTKLEARIDGILERAYEAKDIDALNAFINKSTREQKWGYKIKADSTVPLDPELERMFNALSPEAQAAAREVFAHGHQMIVELNQLVKDELATGYDTEGMTDKEKAKIEKQKLRTLALFNKTFDALSGPYAPLVRMGNYVAVAKSQAYLDAVANEDTKLIEALTKDANHYVVSFHESLGEAKLEARRLAATGKYAKDGSAPDGFAKEHFYNKTSETPWGALKRVRQMIEAETDESSSESRKAGRAMRNMLNDLYFSTLAEGSARQFQNKRSGVHGETKDMLRAFAVKGRADAHFLTSLKYSAPIMESISEMRKAPSQAESGKRADVVRDLNEVLARHATAMEYRAQPTLAKLQGFTSFWMLVTNPAYYLQNATQPFLMSLPWLAGRYGYAKSWGAFSEAYKALTKGKLDIDKMPVSAAEKAMLNQLKADGILDIGINRELGYWANTDQTQLNTLAKTQHFFNTKIQQLEMVNRISTALAAYRLSNGKAEVAADCIRATHGDYSQFNEPRIFSMVPGGRLLLQFRKFQIIQLTMLAKLVKNSWSGATPEETAVARKSLAFLMGHYAVAAGGLGLPAMSLIGSLIAAALGDPGDPKDEEYLLRRAIGNKEMSDLLLRGVPAYLGVNMSQRLGAQNMLSLTPFANKDVMSKDGFQERVVGLLGPWAGLGSKIADGVGLAMKGDVYKGMEQMVPSGLGNAMKAYRFATEGITQRNHDLVMTPDEIGFANTTLQALGLPAMKLSERQRNSSVLFEMEQGFKDAAKQLKQDYADAVRNGGDAVKIAEKWSVLQEAERRNGFRPSPLGDLYKAPMEQAKRERNVVEGLEFKRNNRDAVEGISRY